MFSRKSANSVIVSLFWLQHGTCPVYFLRFLVCLRERVLEWSAFGPRIGLWFRTSWCWRPKWTCWISRWWWCNEFGDVISRWWRSLLLTDCFTCMVTRSCQYGSDISPAKTIPHWKKFEKFKTGSRCFLSYKWIHIWTEFRQKIIENVSFSKKNLKIGHQISTRGRTTRGDRVVDASIFFVARRSRNGRRLAKMNAAFFRGKKCGRQLVPYLGKRRCDAVGGQCWAIMDVETWPRNNLRGWRLQFRFAHVAAARILSPYRVFVFYWFFCYSRNSARFTASPLTENSRCFSGDRFKFKFKLIIPNRNWPARHPRIINSK